MTEDVKLMYACSAHTDDRVMIDSGYPLFEEILRLLQSAYGKKMESFGNDDLVLSRDEIPLLKTRLEQVLKEKIAMLEVVELPDTSITLFGTKHGLNIRNDEHVTILSLAAILNMTVTEIQENGTIWLYDFSPKKDEINSRLLSIFKLEPNGIAPAAAFEKLKKSSEKFSDLSVEEFNDRVDVLRAKDFVSEKIEKDGTILYPSEKTLRIAHIY